MNDFSKFTNDETEIIAILEQIVKEWFEKKVNGDKQWTIRIKTLLADLGYKKGYDVSTSGLEDKTVTEWLYDFVWYKENSEKYIETVPLVLECEWGRKLKDIKFDFEKLLLANSEMKFMICQAKPNQFEQFCNYFEKAVSSYQLLQSGSRIVVAILDDYNTGLFTYKLFVK